MQAGRKRRGGVLLLIVGVLVILAGLVMAVLGGVIFAHTSSHIGVLEDVYERAFARAQQSGGIGPDMKLAEVTLDHLQEARDGRTVGMALLGGGVFAFIVGAVLIVLSILFKKKLAPTTQPHTAPG